MKDLAIFNDPVLPPNMFEYLTANNAALDRRSTDTAEQIVRFADVTVDVGRRRIMRGDEVIDVTPAEYNLLLFFVQNVDRPLTRDAILNAAWGYDCCPYTRTVDAHVCRLRHKLESNPAAPRHFLTIRGVGYRFLG
jgi:two-component system alkaline phosphatase synthesis response regulator PhoP